MDAIVTVPEPWVIVIFEPAVIVLYSRAVEPLFIPKIWFAVPDVPKPVPPLVNGNAVARVKDEADNAPVKVPPP